MSVQFRPDIRDEIQDLVEEWGKNCTISRNVTVTGADGKESGGFVNQATEILWIQPIGGGSDVKEKGIDEETTHFAWQHYSGYAMSAKDRVLQSGDVFEYDVIRVHIKEAHRVSELKQVTRS